jgi:hypothetical protein
MPERKVPVRQVAFAGRVGRAPRRTPNTVMLSAALGMAVLGVAITAWDRRAPATAAVDESEGERAAACPAQYSPTVDGVGVGH